MLEFYRFSSDALALLVIASTLCAALQAAVFMVNVNRYTPTASRWIEGLTEFFLLLHILLLSLLLSQISADRIRFLIVPPGYTALRYGLFFGLAVLVSLICILYHRLLPLVILPTVLLTLPLAERLFGRAFPWIYLVVLLVWMGRAIYLLIHRRKRIKQEVSSLSIKEAMDALHSGLLYYRASDGVVYLTNRRMELLMTALTGSVQRNGQKFWQMLQNGDVRILPESSLLGEQMVFRLDDDTVWLFRENTLSISRHTYIQISAADVTERWRLTRELWQREQELSVRGEKLAATLANLEAACRDEQISKMQSRMHDAMAQRLAMLMRVLRAEQDMSDADLASFTGDLLSAARDDAKEEQEQDIIASLCHAYSDIGVAVKIHGSLPERQDTAAFLADFIREGVANAVRHGFATEVLVTCEMKEVALLISIANSGIAPAESITEGGGIKELRHKLSALGGELSVVTHPQFTLTAFIPKL